VARIFSVDYKTIEIRPGEVVATLRGDPPPDPSVKDILADDDLIVVPAPTPQEVMSLLWRHCSKTRLYPFRCLIGSKAAADWLGVHYPTQSLWGVPLTRDRDVQLERTEFMFLLADNPFGPIKRVKRVLNGRVGEG